MVLTSISFVASYISTRRTYLFAVNFNLSLGDASPVDQKTNLLLRSIFPSFPFLDTYEIRHSDGQSVCMELPRFHGDCDFRQQKKQEPKTAFPQTTLSLFPHLFYIVSTEEHIHFHPFSHLNHSPFFLGWDLLI